MKIKIKLTRAGLLLIFNLLYVNCCWSENVKDSLVAEAGRLVSEGNDLVAKSSYSEAENLFFKSIEVWNAVDVYDEYKAYPYYSLAILYLETGDYNKCIENFNKAEEILLKARDEYKYLLGAIYLNMGSFFQSYGDYFKAYFYFNESIKIAKGLKYRNENSYSDAIFGKAQTYYYQKKYQLSIELSKSYLKEKKSINESQFERLIGSCLLNLGDYSQAISVLEKSLMGSINQHERHSEALLITAKAYLKAGNLQKSEDYLKKSLPLLKEYKTERDPWNIYYYDLLGQLYIAKAEANSSIGIRQNLLGEALKVVDQALLLNSNSEKVGIPYLDCDGDFITPTQVQDIFISRAKVLNSIADNYYKMGEIQLSKQYLELSMQTWEATVKFLNDFRVSFLEEESKLSLNESQVDVYTEGFLVARKLYHSTGLQTYFKKMLFFSESGKSSTFMASLNAVQAQNFGGLPDTLLRYEKELNMQLSTLKQLIFNEKSGSVSDSTLLRGWENNLFNLQKQHDELVFRFERDYPSYYAFKYNQKVVTTSEIQTKLNWNQALIEYFVDEPVSKTDSGTINVLLFTSMGHSVRTTKISYEYVKTLQNMLDHLSNHNVGDTNLSDFKEFTSSASYLYSVLVQPLEIENRITSLIIIPDGKLAYLPFDALLSSKPDTTRISFSTPDYLVRRFNMVYSYSATLHFDYFKSKKRSDRNILAFAPEYPGGDVDINQAAYRKRYSVRAILRPLPGARDEVDHLSTYNKCKAYTGREATETVFKREAAGYDILHLAMHTIMNDSIPMFSKLVFSSSADTVNDGYLNTQEIYNMQLNARLAVLSACNTGSGQMRTGEGVMSMARAFLYAGCPSIVMTLWEVEDRSSAKLMLNFYRYLFKGYSKPEALQKAKLDHLANADPLKAHPYFWMGYIVVGDPTPLKYQNGVVICILIFGMVLVVFLFVGRKAIRKNRMIEK